MTTKYPSKVSYGLLTFVFLMFYGPLIPDLLTGHVSVAGLIFLYPPEQLHLA